MIEDEPGTQPLSNSSSMALISISAPLMIDSRGFRVFYLRLQADVVGDRFGQLAQWDKMAD